MRKNNVVANARSASMQRKRRTSYHNCRNCVYCTNNSSKKAGSAKHYCNKHHRALKQLSGCSDYRSQRLQDVTDAAVASVAELPELTPLQVLGEAFQKPAKVMSVIWWLLAVISAMMLCIGIWDGDSLGIGRKVLSCAAVFLVLIILVVALYKFMMHFSITRILFCLGSVALLLVAINRMATLWPMYQGWIAQILETVFHVTA